jgi:hypothetical protein
MVGQESKNTGKGLKECLRTKLTERTQRSSYNDMFYTAFIAGTWKPKCKAGRWRWYQSKVELMAVTYG